MPRASTPSKSPNFMTHTLNRPEPTRNRNAKIPAQTLICKGVKG